MTNTHTSGADIALVLEGTFPYVGGGVSSWINQMIRAYPQYRFALVFLGGRRSDYGERRYELPANVVHFEEHFLYDIDAGVLTEQPAARRGSRAGDELARRLVQALAERREPAEVVRALREVMRHMLPGGELTREDFLYSERSWELICELYRRHCTDPSFVDFFWTLRIMLQPLWLLARVAHQLVDVRVVHSASTGYAGFLGALLQQTRGLPFILSEHGIYTKERKIDLFKSEWIRDNRNVFQRDPTELSYFRRLWIEFFEWLGRFCYAAADPIVALYEANRQRQISDGAPPGRTMNIPNGIRLERFAPLRGQRAPGMAPVLCLIGRVVPIKDIKTFVRAMFRVVNQFPDAQGWIAGPEDEDPAYARECRNLVSSLGLEENVLFLGFRKVEDLLPKVGLVVLSSISEALPLSVLEGFAAGVPAVVTDVGACRELVEGVGEEDRALGSAGAVVPIAAPQSLADAALALLSDPRAWEAASQAAVARVQRHYTDTLMFERYARVYEQALGRHEGVA
ncbi:GT4 family glycosyltransferase PelF [Comamonas sp. NLF-1-9]|uniref:GT4 family glycosyltransferase PelF n=1 Tax=Comamonas sp. NLF-1-9 TaxID=2853163 RepID=UPI001C43ED11|nr:GT4 family glycosyltransferase PelF [Comamonas sp. NLF-1-9]QXL83252.1 GT4 family glycosyltransferase PelF [Comamonas sp. NLF-1-9]